MNHNPLLSLFAVYYRDEDGIHWLCATNGTPTCWVSNRSAKDDWAPEVRYFHRAAYARKIATIIENRPWSPDHIRGPVQVMEINL